MFVLADYLFVVLHTAFVVFNLTGWAWRRTRRLHLAAISLTLLSWFGLGIFYGWGYCPCTDWHWQIKRYLGETELPHTYFKYYADHLTGIDWDPLLVEAMTFVAAMGALVLSGWFNWRDRKVERSGLAGT